MELIYQLRIALTRIKPPIWRRVQVPGEITLAQLHQVIQTAMGWQDYHMHEFAVKPGKVDITTDDFRRAQTNDQDRNKLMNMMRLERIFMPLDAIEAGGGYDAEDEAKVTLMEICPREKYKLTYVYDFGDHWIHEVIVQKILPAKPGVKYPICTAGKRACPPEDCGGLAGYGNLIEVLEDPGDDEYEELLNWVGEEFDPEGFDPEEVNEVFWGEGGG